jgi:hypothetical protein
MPEFNAKEMPPLTSGLPTEAEQLAARDAARLAARQPDPLVDGIADLVRRSEHREYGRAPMTMAEVAAPFSQREHDQLIESVDSVATDWVNQLKHIRKNSETLEQLVLERLSKLKSNLTELFVLGSTVVSEAKRGEEVNSKLTAEINKLAEEHPAREL